MTMGNQTSMDSYVPGAVGPFIDELPLITHAMVKPYVIANLLHVGEVRFQAVMAAITPHCPQIDMKVGGWDAIENCEVEDKTRAELILEEVLGEMVAAGIIQYNEEEDKWILDPGSKQQNIPTIINWAAATGGQIPGNVLLELGRQNLPQLKRL